MTCWLKRPMLPYLDAEGVNIVNIVLHGCRRYKHFHQQASAHVHVWSLLHMCMFGITLLCKLLMAVLSEKPFVRSI